MLSKTTGSNQYQSKYKYGSSAKFLLATFIFMAGMSAGLDWYHNSSTTHVLYASEEVESLSEPTTTPAISKHGQVKSGEEEVPGSSSSEVVGKYEQIIKDVFGENADTAIAIAWAESGMNPTRVHSDDVEHSVGLFQINLGDKNDVHYEKIPGETREEKTQWLKDPYNNTLIARFIYGSSGWWPWTVYKTGAYKKFL